MRIYLVMAESGEYEDHTEYPLCAFTTEAAAEAFITRRCPDGDYRVDKIGLDETVMPVRGEIIRIKPPDLGPTEDQFEEWKARRHFGVHRVA